MIHPAAIVSPKAKVGTNVKIGPFAVIDGDVTIGDNCIIDAKAHLQFCEIGPNNYIGEGALIGGAPQDLKYKNERTFVKIGSNNTIREYVTIHRATHEGEATIVGDDNFIMAYVHFGHDCRIGNKIIAINSIAMAGHCSVDDGAVISGMVTLHQHCRVGRYAMVGSSTRISKDIPPFVTAEGNEAKIHGLNKVGLKRNGFSGERIKIIQELYSIFFREKLLLAEAVKKIEISLPQNDDVKYFIEFIRTSKRGVER
jgi:UDP-N-acetylglucosamine acyltransferase